MKKIYLIGIIFLLTINLFSFGAFNGMNGRNHPEIKWLEIESENIRVVYHQPLKTEAELAIKFGEAAYQALAKSYGNRPDKKILIYISDQDDIANGATVFDEYFFIYVNQSAYLENFSGTETFLQKVISHEMSHFFLFATVSDWITKIAEPITAITFPQDINEGFAQYYSGETWGHVRGDSYLRTAVYHNDLLSPNKEINGGLLYARGFSIVRYLAEYYGEEKLQELLKYRNKVGIFTFKDAFKEVYGFDWKRLEQDWKQHIRTQYYGYNFEQKNEISPDSLYDETFKSFKEIPNSLKGLSSIKIKNNHALILNKPDKNMEYKELIFAEISSDSLAKDKLHLSKKRKIAELSYAFNYDLSYNGKYAIYCRYSRQKHGSLYPTIYRYNSDTKESKVFFIGNFPQIFNNGDFIYKKQNGMKSEIRLYSNFSAKKIIGINEDAQIENLSLSPNEQLLAFAQLLNGEFSVNIYDLEKRKITSTYSFNTFPRQFNWIDNENLLVASGDSEDFRIALKRINIENHFVEEYQTPPYNISPLIAEIDSVNLKLITLADFSKKGKDIGKLKIKPVKKKFSLPRKTNYYNRWQIRNAENQIIVPDSIDKSTLKYKKYSTIKNIKNRINLFLPINKGIIAGTLFSEPMGKHIVAGGIYQPYNLDDENYYFFIYSNRMFAPTLNFSAFKLAYPGAYSKEKLYWQKISGIQTSANLPLDLINESFWKTDTHAEYAYLKLENLGSNNNKTITGDFSSASYGFHVLYNLPYKNSDLHPIRLLDLDYTLTAGIENGSFDQNYIQHDFISEIAYAPLYQKIKIPFLSTLSIQNHSRLSASKDRTLQIFDFSELTYQEDKITVNAFQPRFRNLENFDPSSYFSSQSEIWLKIADDLDFGISLKNNLLKISYLAIGAWNDIISEDLDDISIKSNSGYELKGVISILGTSFTCKYGIDYKNDYEYFKAYIPFAFF